MIFEFFICIITVLITTKGVTIPVRYKNVIEIPMGLMSEEFLYQSKDDIIKGIVYVIWNPCIVIAKLHVIHWKKLTTKHSDNE